MAKLRFAHIRKLAEIRTDIRAFPNSTDYILKNAIIQALPDTHKGIYFYAMECGGELDSTFVAEHWHIRRNQAADLLRELSEFGLLKRKERHNEHERRFIYGVAL